MGNVSVGGGGMTARVGKASQDTLSRAFSGDVEVFSHAVGHRAGVVGLSLAIGAGFWARLLAAWRLFRTGETVFSLHPRVALDLSRRLMPAAARAELAAFGGIEGGDDIDLGLAPGGTLGTPTDPARIGLDAPTKEPEHS